MMFEQGEQIKRVQECKRDIEAEAKRLQKKITTLQNFKNATSLGDDLLRHTVCIGKYRARESLASF